MSQCKSIKAPGNTGIRRECTHSQARFHGPSLLIHKARNTLLTYLELPSLNVKIQGPLMSLHPDLISVFRSFILMTAGVSPPSCQRLNASSHLKWTHWGYSGRLEACVTTHGIKGRVSENDLPWQLLTGILSKTFLGFLKAGACAPSIPDASYWNCHKNWQVQSLRPSSQAWNIVPPPPILSESGDHRFLERRRCARV